ncbi:MAG TPA: Tm-1-like ATP-binding domain-containing protein, partial [Pirellulales bacterium]|nr:Tm-1-like ATP-binding domain-containing protein [Pirellulales bacterium]
VVLLPRQGVSALDRAGQPFDDRQAREALFAALRAAAGRTSIEELDLHINDPAFAEAAARQLLKLMAKVPSGCHTQETGSRL